MEILSTRIEGNTDYSKSVFPSIRVDKLNEHPSKAGFIRRFYASNCAARSRLRKCITSGWEKSGWDCCQVA